MKISVLGLGYIGLPTGIVLAQSGHQVLGFDINKEVISSLNKGEIHIKEKDLQEAYTKVLKTRRFKAYEDLQIAEVYIIAVPTPFKFQGKKRVVDLSYVISAAEKISKLLKEGDLVILESTSPPETTKKITELLEKRSNLSRKSFHTAYCPERVLPGNILYELLNNDRVIGSEQKEGSRRAKKVYESFMVGGKVYTTDDITAEMCKLVENTSRDIEIAFANELSMICNELGIEVFELIELANKHPRVNILSPGVGVGGHCIAVDPWFLVEKFPHITKLIKMARERNDSKPEWVASKVEEKINYDKLKKIGILGLTYKANVDDIRESPSIRLAHVLQERGYDVYASEPYCKEKQIMGISNLELEKIIKKTDFLVITLAHEEFLKNKSKIFRKKNLNVIGLK